MTIYLDIVLLENIVLNYIIIISTAIISKSKINILNIILSSFIGGVYAIFNYIANINLAVSVTIKILISICMMVIAFKEYQLNKLLKILMFFYLVSFTFGGIAFMLLFFIDPQSIVMNGNYFVGTYPIKVTVMAGGIGFIIITIIAEIIKNRVGKKVTIYNLEISYRGNLKKMKTMLDTGNLLKEPISNADVVIVEKDSLIGMISEEILNNITNITKGKWLEKENIHSYKLKIIPFSSLGNENGILIGFKPDYIKVYNEEEYIRNDILIGIYDGKLSKSNRYTSLIGLDILKNNARPNNKKIKI